MFRGNARVLFWWMIKLASDLAVTWATFVISKTITFYTHSGYAPRDVTLVVGLWVCFPHHISFTRSVGMLLDLAKLGSMLTKKSSSSSLFTETEPLCLREESETSFGTNHVIPCGPQPSMYLVPHSNLRFPLYSLATSPAQPAAAVSYS
ncbi:hypothetical protein CC86DRAFT_22859 [Ophiobolus disseminans]|uniref:Uncharacterized protein n=1 Tax=Ophiobolus disseminans TaxID=1469910 RepID=A0A6A7A274_9PLEO|nr:hypothetical protein CC86DRAFT_22859 [Ophiobolus disseminans]